MSPNFFLTSSSHVFTLSTVTHPQPCTRIVFVELVIEVPPHIAETSVVETRSDANVEAIFNLVHDLTIPKEKFTTASFSQGFSFDRSCVCVRALNVILVCKFRMFAGFPSVSDDEKSKGWFICTNIGSGKLFSSLKLFA